MMNACVLIPIYNNHDTISAVLDQIAAFQLPCIIANDGSNQATRYVLDTQDKQRPWIQVLHLPRHAGKGAAVQAGFLRAHELRYSHALLIDADGQHNVADIPRFLAEAAASPTALILGKPTFGDDAPRARVTGRKISQCWVCVETLSRAIGDPLFGMRVYPIATTAALITRKPVGFGMEFDTDIAVRLYWAGVPMRNVATTVFYPEGGLSHFHMVRDNIRISLMHTRLFFGMLPRLPHLLRLRKQR